MKAFSVTPSGLASRGQQRTRDKILHNTLWLAQKKKITTTPKYSHRHIHTFSILIWSLVDPNRPRVISKLTGGTDVKLSSGVMCCLSKLKSAPNCAPVPELRFMFVYWGLGARRLPRSFLRQKLCWNNFIVRRRGDIFHRLTLSTNMYGNGLCRRYPCHPEIGAVQLN